MRPPGGVCRAIEKAEPEARHVIVEEKAVVAKKAWTLEGSIWAGRRAWADSRAFYDSLGFLTACFSADWAMAMVGGGLERAVMRFHTKGGDSPAERCMASWPPELRQRAAASST